MSNNKDTLDLHPHTMREAPTESEARLWRALRLSQLGVAFRRQVPLLGFIADFYAPSVRLVVEVDGGYHARRASTDARRDRKVRRIAGNRSEYPRNLAMARARNLLRSEQAGTSKASLRLQAELVMRNLPAALLAMRRALVEP